MTHENLVPFGRYVRLYTLHQVEGPVELLMLRIQIETLHYSFMPLLTDGVSCHEIDAAYAADPRTGAALVRQAVLPRLQTLLDTREPFHELGEGSAARWARYAAACGLPAQPRRIPVIHAPSVIPRLPARGQMSERLAQIQRALETVQTAVETASTLAALWQNWQIGHEQRKLLEMQRRVLYNAIQDQIDGQERALDQALNQKFVRGYLADHTGDTAYEALFEAAPEPDI